MRAAPRARDLGLGAGASYLATVALIVWFALGGQGIRDNPGCQPVSIGPAIYWLCNDAAFWRQFLVNALNLGLTATVWAPLFIAAAIAAPEIAPFATVLVMTNLVGLPAALFVLWRSARMLLGAVTRHNRMAS